MKGLSLAVAFLLLFVFLLPSANTASAASVPSITLVPTAGIVGAPLSIRGQGYPPGTNLNLEWGTAVASWVVTGNPPRVTGVDATPVETLLAGVETTASGTFSANVTVPNDFGGQHVIQAYLANGTAITGRGLFTLEPSFAVSPGSGSAGSPISVTAKGLGYGLYSTNYFLYWDNSMVGYFTAVTTHGATNFTFYASGAPGTHYIEVYQGYPGPAYLNPWDSPASLETQSLFAPYIPFHTTFNMTGSTSSTSFVVPSLVVFAAALVSVGLFVGVAKAEPERRSKLVRGVAAVTIIAAIIAGGVGAYLSFGPTASTQGFTPQATVVRPGITVPQNNMTSGPRITVSPDVATVGQEVTVSGAGFSPGAQVPLSISARKGDNILGFKLVNYPLKNVTASPDGSFSFSMAAPPSLGGIHYISASNLTTHSNGTLFIERIAWINATEGPAGTTVAVKMEGVGWTFNTNIAALDYDNSYVGYACGFFSGGNVTFVLTVTGAPGVHTIDVYPSVWWGPSNQANQLAIEYRYPLLTPQDHPELMPSFHFTFLITSPGQQAQSSGTILPSIPSLGLAGLAVAGVFVQTPPARGSRNRSGVARR
jgi:hypothetical protein